MMRGFRPRAFLPKGKKASLEDDKFFSDEDEFDTLFYSERENDYVKKSTKPIRHIPAVKTPRKLEPQLHPLRNTAPDEELTLTEELPPNLSTSTTNKSSKQELSQSKIKKGQQGPILTKDSVQMGISKIFKGTIAHGKGERGEAVKVSQLKNVVSLHLQNKGFLKIMPDAFQSFGSLAHLYLYDNKITEMVGLSDIPQLESLYLSGNRIKRIDNLDNSFNLRQLYLGHNEIEVIEGLENLSMLVELHVEFQKLPPEQSLIFCPNSLDTISRKLKVLNTSGNQLDSIEDLGCMNILDTLNLSRNKLTNLDHTSQVLQGLKQLRVLDLRENSILKDPKYKEKIIGYCSTVELLDGKEVNDTQRTALRRMCAIKATRLRNQQMKFNRQRIHPVSSFPGAFHQQLHPEEMMSNQSLTMAMMMPMMPTSIDAADNMNNMNDNFVFSTPISMSPTPDQDQHYMSRRMMVPPSDGTHLEDTEVEIAIQNEVADFYAGRSTNILQTDEEPEEPEKMSEMAKIIFRLSNLSPSQESFGGSSRTEISPSASYWRSRSQEVGDRVSSFKESRPLSPLEVGVDVISSTSQSAFIHNTRSSGGLSVGKRILRRPMGRKLPPRSSVVGAGRTLSPLEELPTPDSTVRDPNEGRNNIDWFSPQSSLQPSTRSLPTLPELPKGKGMGGFMPTVSKIRSETIRGKR